MNLIKRLFVTRLAPWLAKHPFVWITLGLIYVISPLDLFPEAFTGVVGYADDIIALLLGLSFLRWVHKTDFEKAPSDVSTPPSKNPHEILGIPKNASPKEISDAYRNLIQQYHPDKVAHLGPDLQKIAAQKTKQIQAAYDQLQKNR